MNRNSGRRRPTDRLLKTLTKGLVWVVLVVFVLTSVGVVLAIR